MSFKPLGIAPRGIDAAGGNSSNSKLIGRRRSAFSFLVIALCALVAFSGFVALGSWQVKRLAWKRALIAQVEQRVHAPPTAAPGKERWSQVRDDSDAYRHVRATGTFLHDRSVRVQAVTELGAGFWMLTPLRTADGSVLLINRGFIAADDRAGNGQVPSLRVPASCDGDTQGASEASPVVVTGLLRISEPGGAFLRHNDPAHQRWYSRDVAAIGASQGITNVAPYFIDADAGHLPVRAASSATSLTCPVGGLTVITFQNNHLVYAVTWYVLALMMAGGFFRVWREHRRHWQEDGLAADKNDGNNDDGSRH